MLRVVFPGGCPPVREPVIHDEAVSFLVRQSSNLGNPCNRAHVNHRSAEVRLWREIWAYTCHVRDSGVKSRIGRK